MIELNKIFVCEFITGGGLCGKPLPKSLAKEGALMRDALLHDLSVLPYQILTSFDQRVPIDARLGTSNYAACRPIDTNENAWNIWAELIETCDAVLVIAPETDCILAKFAALTKRLGKIWLGCSLDAIDICGDKLKTYQFLKQIHVPVPTFTLADFLDYDAQNPNVLFAHNNQYVCKPRFGVGCEDTFIVTNKDALLELMQNGREASHIIQLFIKGKHASLVMLCMQGKTWLISANRQLIFNKNNELQFNGIIVNGYAQHQAVFSRIAEYLAEKLPGLNGLVGVDIVFTEKMASIIEINPRVTTSYVGLSQSIGQNPAKLLLDCWQNDGFNLPKLQQKRVEILV